MEFSGTVESVGSAVTSFKPGCEVFGGTLFKLGCHAEYVCLPTNVTVILCAATPSEGKRPGTYDSDAAEPRYPKADIDNDPRRSARHP